MDEKGVQRLGAVDMKYCDTLRIHNVASTHVKVAIFPFLKVKPGLTKTNYFKGIEDLLSI